MDREPPDQADWRSQRRAGIVAIAGAMLVAAALWFGIRFWASPIPGMEDIGAGWCSR